MLKPWKTPFFDKHFPSINLYHDFESHGLTVVVEDQWRVKFDHLLALKVIDESLDRNERFVNQSDPNKEGCSFIWQDSDWIKSLDYEYVQSVHGLPMHFVLLGGDLNVEILSSMEPVFIE